MDKITLVTASGDRWPSLRLVMKYMERQDYPGDIDWIIVDDSQEPYPIQKQVGKIAVMHIYRGPCPKHEEGHASLSKNLITAVSECQNNKDSEMIAVIGDDDWYRKDYLSEMAKQMNGVKAAGHQWVIYGYPPDGIKQLHNEDYAGLESTVFHPDLIHYMIAACIETMKDTSRWADWRFWKKLRDDNIPRNVHKWEPPHEYAMVSLKGKSRKGRHGVGDSHGHAAKISGLSRIIPKDDMDELMKEVYC